MLKIAAAILLVFDYSSENRLFYTFGQDVKIERLYICLKN